MSLAGYRHDLSSCHQSLVNQSTNHHCSARRDLFSAGFVFGESLAKVDVAAPNVQHPALIFLLNLGFLGFLVGREGCCSLAATEKS